MRTGEVGGWEEGQVSGSKGRSRGRWEQGWVGRSRSGWMGVRVHG